MNYLNYFETDEIVEACVAGAGDFGAGVLRQAINMKVLSARIAVDVDARSARLALERAGIEKEAIIECHDADQALKAWTAGHYIASGDLGAVVGLPFDVLVEATGIPEVGAQHAEAAIEAGKHVGIATKETESVVGPYLTHKALDRGLIFTPLDGDQPSLLIGMVTWARTLGFEIVAAGKSSEYDFVWDEASRDVQCNGVRHSLPAMMDLWTLADGREAEMAGARIEIASDMQLISVPDLCEMANVANATGLVPDRPEFHAPLLRIPEVPSVLDTRDQGGILADTGRLEVFNCLRKPDESSFAGGVFVVLRCEDPASWELLRGKGHVVSRSGASAMVYLPRHLLGLEAPISLLDAVLHGRTSGGGRATRPRIDLVARATRDLPAGHRFEMVGHHRVIDGLRPEAHPARPIDGGGAAPFYLLPGTRLLRDVVAGEPIPFDALENVPDSVLLRLRREQDKTFFREPS
ncbi:MULTISPECIES: flagellar biosynthesis protein FlgA [unclassified Modicisalibacter]|uniref:NAD(P)H-dependent oxidoreductase n=1 Tax=unclassified Modicisalibacter TaxID=2679913 RepID=UPI001CD03D43|nr:MULTISPECIES: flagellar biosynthesis protein FlgA [unclassified Modicisalibacter]MBZ9559908.1 flagellar biosynthesis protein FlgA [Modicisalibacter sp. R2A 31.J]MBZ9575816.1 flagellar biosynthesis protein FlgA [Modicisalibacter sp. MOD 31.J]